MNESIGRVIQRAIDAGIDSLNVSIPAIVEQYNADTQTADIIIGVKEKSTDKPESYKLPEIPVVFPATSNTQYIALPITTDTTGLLVTADYNIADWLVSGGTAPVTRDSDDRTHNISDSVFVPGLRTKESPVDYSGNNLEIRNGQMSVVLHNDGKIEISGASEEMVSVLSGFMGEVVTQMTALVGDAHGGTCAHALAATWVVGGRAALTAWQTKLDTMKE